MKHYNEDPQVCYPQNNIMDICTNCARYIENKKDGEYLVVNYRTSGSCKIYTNDNGEQIADFWCDCHPGNDYFMFETFDDEGIAPVVEPNPEDNHIFVEEDE